MHRPTLWLLHMQAAEEKVATQLAEAQHRVDNQLAEADSRATVAAAAAAAALAAALVDMNSKLEASDAKVGGACGAGAPNLSLVCMWLRSCCLPAVWCQK